MRCSVRGRIKSPWTFSGIQQTVRQAEQRTWLPRSSAQDMISETKRGRFVWVIPDVITHGGGLNPTTVSCQPISDTCVNYVRCQHLSGFFSTKRCGATGTPYVTRAHGHRKCTTQIVVSV